MPLHSPGTGLLWVMYFPWIQSGETAKIVHSFYPSGWSQAEPRIDDFSWMWNECEAVTRKEKRGDIRIVVFRKAKEKKAAGTPPTNGATSPAEGHKPR